MYVFNQRQFICLIILTDRKLICQISQQILKFNLIISCFEVLFIYFRQITMTHSIFLSDNDDA